MHSFWGCDKFSHFFMFIINKKKFFQKHQFQKKDLYLLIKINIKHR
jgi:hypothetical protein